MPFQPSVPLRDAPLYKLWAVRMHEVDREKGGAGPFSICWQGRLVTPQGLPIAAPFTTTDGRRVHSFVNEKGDCLCLFRGNLERGTRLRVDPRWRLHVAMSFDPKEHMGQPVVLRPAASVEVPRGLRVSQLEAEIPGAPSGLIWQLRDEIGSFGDWRLRYENEGTWGRPGCYELALLGPAKTRSVRQGIRVLPGWGMHAPLPASFPKSCLEGLRGYPLRWSGEHAGRYAQQRSLPPSSYLQHNSLIRPRHSYFDGLLASGSNPDFRPMLLWRATEEDPLLVAQDDAVRLELFVPGAGRQPATQFPSFALGRNGAPGPLEIGSAPARIVRLRWRERPSAFSSHELRGAVLRVTVETLEYKDQPTRVIRTLVPRVGWGRRELERFVDVRVPLTSHAFAAARRIEDFAKGEELIVPGPGRYRLRLALGGFFAEYDLRPFGNHVDFEVTADTSQPVTVDLSPLDEELDSWHRAYERLPLPNSH